MSHTHTHTHTHTHIYIYIYIYIYISQVRFAYDQNSLVIAIHAYTDIIFCRWDIAKVVDCNLKSSEFKLQSYCFLQFGTNTHCCILAFDPAKNAIPRWCTGRRWHILMAVRRGNCVGRNWLTKWDKLKIPIVLSKTDVPEENDLWSAWQLFTLYIDQTCDFKDRVGDRVDVELLYNSVKTEVKTVAVTVGDGVIDEMW